MARKKAIGKLSTGEIVLIGIGIFVVWNVASSMILAKAIKDNPELFETEPQTGLSSPTLTQLGYGNT